jgi:hypothetical protein
MIDSDAIKFGRNAEHAAHADDRYTRCARCGFMCHLDRDIHPKGKAGWGLQQPSTALATAITVGDTIVTVDSTTGFASSGYIYVYADGHMMPFKYASCSSSVFTGDTSVTATRAFDVDDVVRGEQTVTGGCPNCGTYNYNQ